MVAVIAVVLILVWPSRKIEAPDVPAATSTSAANAFSPISYKTDGEKTENPNALISLSFPVITGLESGVINAAVNAEIKKVFDDARAQFLDDTKNVTPSSPEEKNQLTLSAGAPVSSRKGTFYIDISMYSYYSGAAHPLSNRTVLNFVRENGQLIRLEDILKKDSKGSIDTSLAGVSELAKAKIKAELAKKLEGNDGYGSVDEIYQPDGAAPIADNYQVFYLQKDSIDWVFGQYQVAPYVFGEVKVSIPLKDLKPYLADRAYLQ